MKKLLISVFYIIATFCILNSAFWIQPVYAAEEFAASYNIHYEVDETGMTTVTEGVTLKNLTDQYYASNFTLDITASDIQELKALDAEGPLVTDIQKDGTKSKISVKFNQQVLGKGKEYVWSLQFKSKDFAQKNGNVWQVSIPKFGTQEASENFNLTLSVPTAFGDPSVITPDPTRQNESGGKINFSFSKDQLTKSGILATFGQNQTFSFNLKYHLTNNGLLPELVRLPLPPDTPFQQIIINNINPKPENVTRDIDGNYIGIFKLDRKQSKEITVEGAAKVFISPQYATGNLTAEEQKLYTKNQEFWPTTNPLIRTRMNEIFKKGEPRTNLEKSKLIYDFVTEFLTYDTERYKTNNFERLGALTALSSPTLALCNEFSDLFITLARSANVPARQLIGYAFTNNNSIRPLSFNQTELHSWVEFYDPRLGWLMVDPTWGNTTGGVDYFSRFDLSHLVLAIRGESSINPIPADTVKVVFSEQDFVQKPNLEVSILGYRQIYAGLPNTITIEFKNTGNSATMEQNFIVKTSNLNLIGLDGKSSTEKSLLVSALPPYGSARYEFKVRASNLWQSGAEMITVKSNNLNVEYPIAIKPFFQYKYFSLIVVSLIGGMFLLYLLIVGIHFKVHKHIHKKLKKKGSK